MNLAASMDRAELIALEGVAEGRADALPEGLRERLLNLGLVINLDPYQPLALQLTAEGLALIRSSDQ